MQEKILVTGGSGFIGTNLTEYFLAKGFEVKNIDKTKPKHPKWEFCWCLCDIEDYEKFREEVLDFKPDYIVHLAARTDLDGKTVEAYSANTIGVKNLMKIIQELPNLKKIIITSSQFVFRNGYQPKSPNDYCPHTVYGESKVITEQEVWANKPHCDWCIIRPTSIWGPWFGVPYRNFFDMVMRRMYFHIGKTKCHKTYGYVGNVLYQIEALLFSETLDEQNKTFFIGDMPPYEINEWADEIAQELGFRVPTMPVWVVKCLAKFGDFLGIFGVHFPMQSFRFGNMTNDNVRDLQATDEIAPERPYERLEGVRNTLAWMKEYEDRK